MTSVEAATSISEIIVGQGRTPTEPLDELLPRMLRAIRRHLAMDVAFVSEFSGGRRYFRHVDSSHPNPPIQVGGSDPLEESYCQRVCDGRLPELIPDAAKIPGALDLPVTTSLPVGAHLSVPIRFKDGQVFGTFCCISSLPNTSLNDRDLAMLRVLADISADRIELDLEVKRARAAMLTRIDDVLSGDSLSMVYQPIHQLAANKIVGFEALARFSTLPTRAPDVWFSEAAQVDRGRALESKAIKQALLGIDHLPGDVYVSVNASPESILEGDVESVLKGWPLARIMLEVTEHAAIDHYGDIAKVIEPLRKRGLRVAVDDAGAGYASFRHILSLAPDVIKLDISLTRNIDTDRSRRALAAALISFAQATSSKIVAEGVETASELSALRQLGVNKAQGYFLGKPMTLASAAKLAQG